MLLLSSERKMNMVILYLPYSWSKTGSLGMSEYDKGDEIRLNVAK